MQLYWHRSDLRGVDNRGLAEAASAVSHESSSDEDGVIPVFIFDDDELERDGNARVQYMLDSIAELRSWYRDRGSDLLIARGDPASVLPELAIKYDVDRVVWSREYSGFAQSRDEQVADALTERDIAHQSVRDAIFFEPGSITTNKGEPYSVYTYFWKKWRDRDKDTPIDAPAADVLMPDEATGDSLPTIDSLGFEEPTADIQPAGTNAAHDRLSTFCDDGIYRYDDDRDYPSRNAVSRLSADLSLGTIGVRDVYAATVAAAEADGITDAEAESVEEFQSQLAWREFYTHVLYFNPEVVTENYKTYENEIQWADDPAALQAWKEGKTGYPIVDAGMRQLKSEAYMHNRLRMIVASFLTKDLLIDWREGYGHFRQHLADHNIANNNGGWQWAASTGTDAQPYFRIFNPMTQGERYDPDAEYIKQHVPELREVSAETIHEWHELSPTERARLDTDYPAPIVDHSEQREKALEMFETARGDA
ncbi:deoxyribodipyrimidine photo-lyase [Haloquadratum walsbyi]|jgi:deoxyribodipyrimidine photo-lyase type I|uniref:Deoxyribodipyrimidine photolyase n=1 Tax=Haloquadratum walsbyi J07HQW2 TaxID=1238425 RepID=U1ND59_9EURY|nr:deoxyribodipyrimidine photo-lyase [Haloquadratum walsbyi]ERG94653.1 MAG: deoxyribodipyrimidine photolyase [Haloquadratum walsbyi J07HQW2]